jgi:hypothetical protein
MMEINIELLSLLSPPVYLRKFLIIHQPVTVSFPETYLFCAGRTVPKHNVFDNEEEGTRSTSPQSHISTKTNLCQWDVFVFDKIVLTLGNFRSIM